MVLRSRDRGRVGRRRHSLVRACAQTTREAPALTGWGFVFQSSYLHAFPDRLLVMSTRAGIVTVAGRPNVGKSTLLNRIVGRRLAITSRKPQSTRNRVVGILSDALTQIVLLDTPGLLEPGYALQRSMRWEALRALGDADIVVHVLDAASGHPEPLAAAADLALDRIPRAPTLTVFNKSDTLSLSRRDGMSLEWPESLLVSARTGDGVPELLTRIRSMLPESPFLYDADDLSSQNMRFFAAEMIRETALEQLDDEVPYSVACEVEEYRESQSPVYIRVVLHVERESQKRILIGDGGARIKAIGTDARAKVESLVGGPVYLDLRVKVLANWRRDESALARLGYQSPRNENSRSSKKDGSA
jgi:GTP-binding protein Era